MKRLWLNKKRLAILTSLCASLVLLAAFLERYDPLLLKLVVGEARIVSPEIQATVKVNGIGQPTARCFAMKSTFDGMPIRRLVLWLPDASASYGRLILIIDKPSRRVGQPNSTDDDYRLYGNRVLVQSESGSLPVWFDEAKSYGEDPHRGVGSNSMTFTMPRQQYSMPGKRIEIYQWPPGHRMIDPLTGTAAPATPVALPLRAPPPAAASGRPTPASAPAARSAAARSAFQLVVRPAIG